MPHSILPSLPQSQPPARGTQILQTFSLPVPKPGLTAIQHPCNTRPATGVLSTMRSENAGNLLIETPLCSLRVMVKHFHVDLWLLFTSLAWPFAAPTLPLHTHSMHTHSMLQLVALQMCTALFILRHTQVLLLPLRTDPQTFLYMSVVLLS